VRTLNKTGDSIIVCLVVCIHISVYLSMHVCVYIYIRILTPHAQARTACSSKQAAHATGIAFSRNTGGGASSTAGIPEGSVTRLVGQVKVAPIGPHLGGGGGVSPLAEISEGASPLAGIQKGGHLLLQEHRRGA